MFKEVDSLKRNLKEIAWQNAKIESDNETNLEGVAKKS